ncbi:MAG TPA: transposase [Aldersonia sp.]
MPAEGAAFARPGSGHTRDFEDLVAWPVTHTDKTTVGGSARDSWRTVGAICERGTAECSTPTAVRAGRHRRGRDLLMTQTHRYLTLLSDHATGTILCGRPGKDTVHAFFDELGAGAQTDEAVSMDMGPAHANAVRAPPAVLCVDPCPVVQLVTPRSTRCAAGMAGRPHGSCPIGASPRHARAPAGR